jgi:hypothetical protein
MLPIPVIAVGLLIVVHLAIALGMAYGLQLHGDAPEAIVVGIGFGQVNLIGLWGALAAGRVVKRLPAAGMLAVGMWLAIACGQRLIGVWEARSDSQRGEAIILGILIGLGAVVTFLPLWIARRWFHWRLTASDNHEPDAGQFHLRELLIGTALLCLALGAIQAVLPGGRAELRLDRFLWLAIPIIAVGNLIVILPTIRMVFAVRRLVLGYCVFIMPLYALVVGLAELMLLAAALGLPTSRDGWFEFWLLNLAQCLTAVCTLGVLRMVGFRLARPAISLKVPPATSEVPTGVQP